MVIYQKDLHHLPKLKPMHYLLRNPNTKFVKWKERLLPKA